VKNSGRKDKKQQIKECSYSSSVAFISYLASLLIMHRQECQRAFSGNALRVSSDLSSRGPHRPLQEQEQE